jgi:hypothetical protein
MLFSFTALESGRQTSPKWRCIRLSRCYVFICQVLWTRDLQTTFRGTRWIHLPIWRHWVTEPLVLSKVHVMFLNRSEMIFSEHFCELSLSLALDPRHIKTTLTNIQTHICDDCSLSHWLLLKKTASQTPSIVKKTEFLNILLTFRIILCFDCVHFHF